MNILGPAGPTLARHVHVTSTAIGNVFTGEGLGNTLGSSIVGPMLARHSGHAIIAALGIVLFFAVAAVPACESLTQVFALYVGIGSCLGLINGACNTMITWVQHGRNVGRRRVLQRSHHGPSGRFVSGGATVSLLYCTSTVSNTPADLVQQTTVPVPW